MTSLRAFKRRKRKDGNGSSSFNAQMPQIIDLGTMGSEADFDREFDSVRGQSEYKELEQEMLMDTHLESNRREKELESILLNFNEKANEILKDKLNSRGIEHIGVYPDGRMDSQLLEYHGETAEEHFLQIMEVRGYLVDYICDYINIKKQHVAKNIKEIVTLQNMNSIIPQVISRITPQRARGGLVDKLSSEVFEHIQESEKKNLLPEMYGLRRDAKKNMFHFVTAASNLVDNYFQYIAGCYDIDLKEGTDNRSDEKRYIKEELLSQKEKKMEKHLRSKFGMSPKYRFFTDMRNYTIHSLPGYSDTLNIGSKGMADIPKDVMIAYKSGDTEVVESQYEFMMNFLDHLLTSMVNGYAIMEKLPKNKQIDSLRN